MPAKIEISNLSDLLARYLSGEPEHKLAREAGVNRWTMRRRIISAGIKPRNISDSMFIRWDRATESDKAAMLTNAHIAMRGRVVSDSEKILRAQTIQNVCSRSSWYETQLSDWLKEMGIMITRQRAVHIYNLDIAINEFPIAIEIFGGGWHAYGAHRTMFFKRSKYLFDHGWSLIIVWIDNIRHPLVINCANEIVKYINIFRQNPPAISEYRVILGNGYSAPIRNTYFNTPTIIETLGHCRYIS
jgi:G:T-mismatch repair DNA endonuclease (very short patch repair protein)